MAAALPAAERRPEERCLLRLAGCSDDEAAISSFLFQLTGFEPVELELQSNGLGSALIAGTGAYRKAADVAGKRSDADRRFEILMMHIEWY